MEELFFSTFIFLSDVFQMKVLSAGTQKTPNTIGTKTPNRSLTQARLFFRSPCQSFFQPWASSSRSSFFFSLQRWLLTEAVKNGTAGIPKEEGEEKNWD